MQVRPPSPYSQDNSRLLLLRLCVALGKFLGARAGPPGDCAILAVSMSEFSFLFLPGTEPDSRVGIPKPAAVAIITIILCPCICALGGSPEVWRSASAPDHQAGILSTYSLTHPPPLPTPSCTYKTRQQSEC